MKISFFKITFLLSCGLYFSNFCEAAHYCCKQEYRAVADGIDSSKRIPTEKEIAGQEEKVVSLINAVRVKFHLPELVMKKNLCKTAKGHSINMASGKVEFGHAGFDKRARDLFQLGQHEAFGENVAYTYLMEDPLMASLEGWMNSQGHRENILGDFNETGVGIAFSKQGRCYITQLFAKTVQK